MASGRRWQDTVLMTYFAFQILSTLFFDTQGVYPESWYPSCFKSLRTMYLNHYKDPFLANAWNYPWYLSVCLVEHFIEMPFFVWATLAYFKGVRDRPRVQLASIAYSIHTITAIIAIWFMALGADLTTGTPYLAPVSRTERLTLCTAYFPFMACSIFCLWDSVNLVLNKLEKGRKSE